MKAFRMFARGIRDAIKSVFRNFSLSFASIVSITITLLVMSLSLIISANVNNFSENIIKDVTIVSYLNKETTTEELNTLKKEIENYENVESIKVITKEEAAIKAGEEAEIFKEILSQYEEGENPLYDSYEIKVKDIEKIKITADKLKENEKIEVVKYGEGMVEQLLSVFKLIRNVSYVVLLALLIVTIFLIANTIKLTIYARKKEISIMSLVGASNSLIKFPFMIEGIILGLLGSIIPVLFTIYGYNYIFERFSGKLISPMIQFVSPTPFIFITSIILIGIGLVVGMLGSISSVGKHLKI